MQRASPPRDLPVPLNFADEALQIEAMHGAHVALPDLVHLNRHTQHQRLAQAQAQAHNGVAEEQRSGLRCRARIMTRHNN